MSKTLAVLLVSFALLGCKGKAQEEEHVGDYKVEKLFTHEGCTVYRFHDGHAVYYTNCSGNTQTTYNCGKGCIATQNTPTYRSDDYSVRN